jgi:apolipoprotein N-acyltransferase
MTLYSRLTPAGFWLGWIGLVPWLAVLDAAPGWRATWWLAVGMCCAFTLGLFWWFGTAIEAYAGLPRGTWLVVILLAAPLLQPQFIVLALARRLAARRGRGVVACALVGAGAYVGTEWACGKLLGDTIGHGFLPARAMRQAADLVGAPGLTAVLIVSNEMLLAAWRTGRAGDRRGAVRAAGVVGALVAFLSGYGLVRLRILSAAVAAQPAVTVGVVQGGFANYAELRARHGSFEATRRILNRYFAASEDALRQRRLDPLVWPETVYPTTFGAPKSADGAAFDRALAAFVAGSRVPLVFGGYDADDDGREYNAAVLIEPPVAGATEVSFDTYRKTWLFPLTERVPAMLDRPALRRRLPWLGTWTRGDGPLVLHVHRPDAPPLRIVPLVCYDAVVPAHARAAVGQGADLLVGLSNDAWFGRGPGTWLHLAVSVFRSIETRRPQVRATTTGVSAVIDASGEITSVAGPGEERALVDTVTPAALPPTVVMRVGDWVSPVLLVLGLLLLAL